MAYETIIVAYEDGAAANEAVQAIRRMGVPARDIRRHPVDRASIAEVAELPALHAPDPGFWNWLFGRDLHDQQLAVYEKALAHGGTILSVQVMEEAAAEIRDVLDRFGPLDLSEATGRALDTDHADEA